MSGYHILRTRLADPTVVCASRTFPHENAAKREAQAWADTGEWDTKVHPGRSPAAPCGRRSCSRISAHVHPRQ
jgi:hypothetical protein